MPTPIPWRKHRTKPKTSNNFCFTTCDPCGAFTGVTTKPSDETDNTTLSTHSPSRSSDQSNILNAKVEMDSQSFDQTELAMVSPCENIKFLVEDATFCILNGVCCRRTCADNDGNSLLEACGGANGLRRELRKRRSDRGNKYSQICCTTISWGPDDEEDISVLQDPIIEDGYDGGLNTETPEPYGAEENLATPKHRNSIRNIKSCAYCGITREETLHRMKICSRCRCAYYCSKECQWEDWYISHRDACVPVTESLPVSDSMTTPVPGKQAVAVSTPVQDSLLNNSLLATEDTSS